ncbi:HoxN/HupN/NixA family nickel/cobalt transporter [Edaphobacter sp. HDX4]|uniref:HoxN/HupN/NixA family nickel/cobalt transporter n=1 Tax=Edaphobacter sp. HDX4 TaxID=2794064 RepID=UPI002FE60C3A
MRTVAAPRTLPKMSSALELALFSCALLGLRHGFDYDHLAAITDITSVQRTWREGMRLGLLYALGHALTVAVLGAAVIFLHLGLPRHLDAVGERIVGATLIVLALYVLFAFFRRRSDATHQHVIPASRIALLVSGAQYASWRVRSLKDRELPRPEPFRFRYDRSSVLIVGVLHGLGAETPSQLLLFLLAANLGGTSRGFLGLLCFIGGLLVMNTLMTASASGIFASSRHRPKLQLFVTSLTAVYSFAIGTIFLFGMSDKLPALVR